MKNTILLFTLLLMSFYTEQVYSNCSPSNLTDKPINQHKVKLSWYRPVYGGCGFGYCNYDIVIGQQGFSPNGVGVTVHHNVEGSYTYYAPEIGGNYAYYVRCQDDNVWIGPHNFTTLSYGYSEIDSGLNGALRSAVAFADIDNDGDQDVIIIGEDSNSNRKTILYNNNGEGFYNQLNTPVFDNVFNGAVAFVDIDSDGDKDLLITGKNTADERIAKLYTNDGNGSFTLVTGTVFEGVEFSSVAFADVNNDGDQDVLITGINNSGTRTSYLYKNNGSGSFTQSINTFTGVNSGAVAFADVNNDGFQDILITGKKQDGNKSSKIYMNDGNGMFNYLTGQPFNGVWLSSVAFADIDNDNDQDLLITGKNNADERISKLYTNDGTGDFTYTSNTPFIGVSNSSVSFTDIENDNDQDVIVTGYNTLLNTRVTKLYANNGFGNFNEVNNTPFESVNYSSIAFDDVNNDNIQDVLITGKNNSDEPISKLYLGYLCPDPDNLSATNFTTSGADLDWTENGNATTWNIEIGEQGFTPTETSTYSSITKPFTYSNGNSGVNYDYYVQSNCSLSKWIGPFSFITDYQVACAYHFETPANSFTSVLDSAIAFADIDGDNDQDLLITGRNKPNRFNDNDEIITKLYTNDGTGEFTEILHPFDIVTNSSVAFSDVDGDNDPDLLMSTIGETKLYINDGTGVFTLVSGTSLIKGNITFADIDNDNDKDVLVDDHLYRNDGVGNFVLDTSTSFNIGSKAFADIDNDNDLDLLISDKLYTNDGTGNFTLVTGTNFVNGGVAFADIDGDNFQDIMIEGDGAAKLYKNDGVGVFTLIPDTSFVTVSYSAIAFTDIDGDNDQDVLITGREHVYYPNNQYYDRTYLYTNDGIGNFTFSKSFQGVSSASIAIVDINNDNKQDIFYTGKDSRYYNHSFEYKSALYLQKNSIKYKTTYNSFGWSDGIPNIDKCVVINADYTTNANSFIAYNTTVNENHHLTIAADTFIKVQDDIVNNGIITIEPEGAVVQIDNYATTTGSGVFNTKIETTPLQDQYRFTYFSTPTKNETLNVFNNWGDLNYLWEFNENTQSWGFISDSNTYMQKGNGYIIRANANNSFPFSAITNFHHSYNNGTVTQDLVFTADGNDVDDLDNDNNLVGNPYPSAIDASMLLDANLNPTVGTLYFWTHNTAMNNGDFSTDDYAEWNLSGGTSAISGGDAPTGFIASGQGFFANAEGDETLALGTKETTTLTFNNAMRVTDNNTDFRSLKNLEYDKIWLNLSNTQGVFNQLLIAFLPTATTAYDIAYDGKRNSNGVATFYSLGLNNQHYGIQALGLLQGDTVIPLGYQIENESITNLTISIDHIENLNHVEVYLIDNLLNITHNLSQENYSFQATDIAEYNSRFELFFHRTALNNENISLGTYLRISNLNENQIRIKTNAKSVINNVKGYDVLGKLLINKDTNNNNIVLDTNCNQGTVLFFVIELENGVVLNKKFIKI